MGPAAEAGRDLRPRRERSARRTLGGRRGADPLVVSDALCQPWEDPSCGSLTTCAPRQNVVGGNGWRRHRLPRRCDNQPWPLPAHSSPALGA
jgi:hypothetical protein